MIYRISEIILFICIGKLLNYKEIKNDISINIININIDPNFSINDILPHIDKLYEYITYMTYITRNEIAYHDLLSLEEELLQFHNTPTDTNNEKYFR